VCRETLETIDTIPSGKFFVIQHIFPSFQNNISREPVQKWNYEIKMIHESAEEEDNALRSPAPETAER
jgi:hypothetical protein